MPRCWVSAPYESKKPEAFDQVWQFDVANNLISIGWFEANDVSKISQEKLSDAIASAYPDKPPATKSLYCNMPWAFYHEISPDDFVIARSGRKSVAAVCKITQSPAHQT